MVSVTELDGQQLGDGLFELCCTCSTVLKVRQVGKKLEFLKVRIRSANSYCKERLCLTKRGESIESPLINSYVVPLGYREGA